MRIKLQMPADILFTTSLQIMVQHLNYGNHLGNDSLLSIIHEARVRFFENYGYTEKDIDGTAVIMTDVVINYLSEGFYGNKLLIKMGVSDCSAKSFDLYYDILNETTGKTLAQAKTGILGYNYQLSKTQPFSELFFKRIGIDKSLN